MNAPKRKQASIKLTEEATRALLDTTKDRLKKEQGNAQEVFIEELEKMIKKKGLNEIVEGLSTESNFHDLIVAGN